MREAPQGTTADTGLATDSDLPSSGARELASVDSSISAAPHRRTALLPFVGLLALWLLLFLSSGSLTKGPSPRGLGGDFVLFLSAARSVQHGGDPYDQRVLYRAERSLLSAQHIRTPAFDPYMRVGNPPLLFWALIPLAGVPFHTLALFWCGAMYALCALGFLGCLAFLRWRRRWLPTAMFLAMPQTIYAAYYGNVDDLVILAIGCGAALVRRRPYAAGLILTIALLKPQVALPGALLVILFLSPARVRSLAGFATALAAACVLMLATTGIDSIGWWLHALTGYSEKIGVQPDIASLAGLYVYSASSGVRLGLQVVSLAAALAATGTWWLRKQGLQARAPLGIAWLWILWFLATPFAHFHDEVVLALPVLAVLGADGRWIGRWPPTLCLYVLLLSVLLFPSTRAHTDFQSLTLLVVFVCAVAQYLARSPLASQVKPATVPGPAASGNG